MRLFSLEAPLPATVVVVVAVIAFSRWHPATRARVEAVLLLAAGSASTAWASLTVAAAVGRLRGGSAIVDLPLVPTHRAGPFLTTIAGMVLVSVVAVVASQARTHRRLQSNNGLVLIDDDRPDAFALRGQIAISRGLVELLSDDELAVVLEHEVSHVRHRHDRYLAVARLGAAGAPWLWPVMNRLRFDVERWADEDAAQSTGSRELVAHTIAAVALAGHHSSGRGLAFGRRHVLRRVNAMMDSPPPTTSIVDSYATTTMMAVAAALVGVALHVHHLLLT